MSFKPVSLTIFGEAPLLMHCDTLANPLNPLKKKMSLLTAKRKKTDEDHEAISRLEWEGAMYFDKDLGPYLPYRMMKAAIHGAAKKSKAGAKVRSGLFGVGDKAQLVYEGPRDLEGLWAKPEFIDMRSVVVQRARIIRCRPIFNSWKAEFKFMYDTEVLNKEDVTAFAEVAGSLVGIGDYRPECSGDFGRFSVGVKDE